MFLILTLSVYLFVSFCLFLFNQDDEDVAAIVVFWPIRTVKWFFRTLWKELTQ